MRAQGVESRDSHYDYFSLPGIEPPLAGVQNTTAVAEWLIKALGCECEVKNKAKAKLKAQIPEWTEASINELLDRAGAPIRNGKRAPPGAQPLCCPLRACPPRCRYRTPRARAAWSEWHRARRPGGTGCAGLCGLHFAARARAYRFVTPGSTHSGRGSGRVDACLQARPCSPSSSGVQTNLTLTSHQVRWLAHCDASRALLQVAQACCSPVC